MGSVKLLFFCCYIFALAIAQAQQYPFMHNRCDNNIGNYTNGSTYQGNLNSVLSSLASDTKIDYGFYNFSAGQEPDQVNAIALCRGDVSMDDCRGCVANSTRQILEICPNQKEAIGVYEFCLLRYSNRSIFHVMEGMPTFLVWSTSNASNGDEFKQALLTLLFKLRDVAARGDSLKKFATGNESLGFYTIFGLVQCTPDLSEQQCAKCLVEGFSPMIGDTAKLLASVIKPSCNYAYDLKRFFAITPDSPPLSPPPGQSPPPAVASPPPEAQAISLEQTLFILFVQTQPALSPGTAPMRPISIAFFLPFPPTPPARNTTTPMASNLTNLGANPTPCMACFYAVETSATTSAKTALCRPSKK